MKNCRKNMFYFLFILFMGLSAFAETNLLLIGGGNHPAGVVERFVQYAGGSQARILVITWASGYPEETYQDISQELKSNSGAEISEAPHRPLSPASRKIFLEKLKQASGVYFTGGDQNKIMQVLSDESLRLAVADFYQSGSIVAGTSAGTAIMSPRMLTGNGSETVPGLGLLPGVILDTHFIVRKRIERLKAALLKFPMLIGLGIDEDNAIWVQNGKYVEVMGPTYLTKVINQNVIEQTENFSL